MSYISLRIFMSNTSTSLLPWQNSFTLSWILQRIFGAVWLRNGRIWKFEEINSLWQLFNWIWWTRCLYFREINFTNFFNCEKFEEILKLYPFKKLLPTLQFFRRKNFENNYIYRYNAKCKNLVFTVGWFWAPDYGLVLKPAWKSFFLKIYPLKIAQ